MSKKIVLAEKPSVAKDLARILGATHKAKNYYEGDQYIVTWALGHLVTLKMPEDLKPEWQQWKMEDLPMIPKRFGIKPLPRTGGQLKAISALAKRKDVSGLILSTDSGREGELVGRWILEWIRFDKPVERLWISSQTDKAVKQGFKELKPSQQYDHLFESALARSKADWLVGLNVTRALTVKYEDNLSAGRVQTPTLAAVRQQEQEVEKFIPKTYYTIDLMYQDEKGRLQLKNPQQFSERTEAERFVEGLAERGTVEKVKSHIHTEAAPLPYDLTEIQRVANAKYQFSAKKTLSLVQSLYEFHKVVSYPRTDSKYLPRDVAATMKERLQALSGYNEQVKIFIKQGAKVTQNKVFNDAKVTDHYALIPTEERPRFEKFTADEQKIYRLIVERFLGLFALPYQSEEIKVNVNFGDKATFTFKQTQVVQQGWKFSDSEQMDMNKRIDWEKVQSVPLKAKINQAMTQPPKRMTEGALLAEMEKFGLGTPATRAEIIEKLVKSELIERAANTLMVTPKGKQLLQLVNPSLKTPELTAKWERSLEAIAKGQEKAATFLKAIEADTERLVKEVKTSQQNYQDFSLTNKICPECGAKLREKQTRDGKIYVCSNSECSYRRRKDPKLSNHRCPQCHKKMEIIEGKNGAFFKCKNCSITEKLEQGKGRSKKMNKHEERKLLQKINQQEEEVESPMARALREAMEKGK